MVAKQIAERGILKVGTMICVRLGLLGFCTSNLACIRGNATTPLKAKDVAQPSKVGHHT